MSWKTSTISYLLLFSTDLLTLDTISTFKVIPIVSYKATFHAHSGPTALYTECLVQHTTLLQFFKRLSTYAFVFKLGSRDKGF